MRTALTRLLNIALVIAPMAASAEVVTWVNRGVIEGVNATLPPAFSGVAVGDPFEVYVTFDTDAALWATLPFAPGNLFVYDYSSLVFSMRVGPIGPIEIRPASPGSGNPFYGSALYSRDDSGDKAPQGEPPAQDGYSFGAEFSASESIGIIFRGDVLDIADGPGLPVTPDPRLTDLQLSIFQVLRFDGSGADPFFAEAYFSGRITSVKSLSDPDALLQQLTVDVQDVGGGKSLANKMQLVQAYYAVPDVQSACATLDDFLREVRAQTGKKLTIELVAKLTLDATDVKTAIGCN